MTTTERHATLLPDPEPRDIENLLISVDDHLIEPPDMFEGRMPSALLDRAPRVVELDDGAQAWLFEGNVLPSPGLNAVAGRPVEEWAYDPVRFDEMRPGCFEIEARVRDMDIAGVYASLCFPSYLAGFGGVNFNRSADPELGEGCIRAWNDWHHERWAGPHPDRIIPLQITSLRDPDAGAAEVRRNAERGFKALSFPEFPAQAGFASIYDPSWDPILAACEETETVVCLHTGSASFVLGASPQAPLEVATSLFPANALVATAEWLWSGVLSRFPRLNIALSEGGIGWVPMYIDRLSYMASHAGQAMDGWDDPDLSPVEILERNFWFCTLEDPSAMRLLDVIGEDHVMLETDFPHSDSTWPDCQAAAARMVAGLSDDTRRKVTHGNASRLFRHPLPSGSLSQ